MTLFWTHDPTGCFLPEGPFEEEIEAFVVASWLIHSKIDRNRPNAPVEITRGEYADTPEDQRVKVSEVMP
jgi:hypothetical protein